MFRVVAFNVQGSYHTLEQYTSRLSFYQKTGRPHVDSKLCRESNIMRVSEKTLKC